MTPPPIIFGEVDPITGTKERIQYIQVPFGVRKAKIDIVGGAGGRFQGTGALGGLGGRVQAIIRVIPREILNIDVGLKGNDGNEDYDPYARDLGRTVGQDIDITPTWAFGGPARASTDQCYRCVYDAYFFFRSGSCGGGRSSVRRGNYDLAYGNANKIPPYRPLPQMSVEDQQPYYARIIGGTILACAGGGGGGGTGPYGSTGGHGGSVSGNGTNGANTTFPTTGSQNTGGGGAAGNSPGYGGYNFYPTQTADLSSDGHGDSGYYYGSGGEGGGLSNESGSRFVVPTPTTYRAGGSGGGGGYVGGGGGAAGPYGSSAGGGGGNCAVASFSEQVIYGTSESLGYVSIQWVGGAPPLRQKQRDDLQRIFGKGGNTPRSRQKSVRQGWQGTYW